MAKKMAIENKNLCPICKANRLHGGNKKLAALHSAMTKQKVLNGEIEPAVKEPRPIVYPDRFYFKNGKRVVIE